MDVQNIVAQTQTGAAVPVPVAEAEAVSVVDGDDTAACFVGSAIEMSALSTNSAVAGVVAA